MIENFIAAFIVYFLFIDPVGTALIFLAITPYLNKRQKIRTALEGNFIAGPIMLFFAICSVWILNYLNILLNAFRLAGGIFLLLVVLGMLANKLQVRRERRNDTIATDDNVAIFSLATAFLAGPAAITSVMWSQAALLVSWTLSLAMAQWSPLCWQQQSFKSLPALPNTLSTRGSRLSFCGSRPSFRLRCRFNILLTGYRRLA